MFALPVEDFNHYIEFGVNFTLESFADEGITEEDREWITNNVTARMNELKGKEIVLPDYLTHVDPEHELEIFNEQTKLSIFKPCEIQAITVIMNAAGVFFSMLGINARLSDVGKAATHILGNRAVRIVLDQTLRTLHNGKTGVEKARALISFVGNAYHAFGAKTLISIFLQLNWIEIVINAALLVANIAVWLGSAGVALIAQLAIVLLNAALLTYHIHRYFITLACGVCC